MEMWYKLLAIFLQNVVPLYSKESEIWVTHGGQVRISKLLHFISSDQSLILSVDLLAANASR